MLAVLIAGCVGTEVQVYVKPDQDFSRYSRVAILPVRMAGVEGTDRLKTAENSQQLSSLLSLVAKELHLPIIDADTVTAKLRTAALKSDNSRTTDWLVDAAKACQADCLLSADVTYYGTFTYQVPPAAYPMYDSYWYSYRRYGYYYPYRRYYYQPGYLDTGSRAAMKLLLYDGGTGVLVWWAESEESGERTTPDYYAKKLIKRLLKKLPKEVGRDH